MADASFERHGDYESVLFDERWWRTGEIYDRSRRLAAGLIELGIEPGDRVAVVMTNSPDVGVTYTALWRAGAVITPIIFLVGQEELRRMLADAEATAVVASADLSPSVIAAASTAPSVRHVVVAGGPAPSMEGGPDIVAFDDLLRSEPRDNVPRADDDLAALMYTGGTTGRAKGVMLSHENLWFCGKSSEEASFIEGVDSAIVPLPLSHAFGLITTIVGLHSRVAGRAVLMRWFDPIQWLEHVQHERIQRGVVVPSMLQILLSAPLEDYDLSSLRSIVCGAAPLSLDVVRGFERRVPSVEICEGYGCTESGAVMSTNPPGRRKLGSVGVPIPGYEVRIVGDDGDDVPVGETGEVCCRSRGVMLGYWKDPETTSLALRDGWLHTGDVGRLDDDGYLWIVDRKKDLIIRGGFNVFPRDVEDALLEHPAVSMAGVVGRPDERYGEEVVAFVSLRPGAQVEPDELTAFAKERLGAQKYPREIRLVPVVPLTPVGKVDRKALRAMLGT